MRIYSVQTSDVHLDWYDITYKVKGGGMLWLEDMGYPNINAGILNQ